MIIIMISTVIVMIIYRDYMKNLAVSLSVYPLGSNNN